MTFAEMGGDTMTLDPRTWGRGPQVLALTSIGTFLVSLDSSITTVAFRDIVGDFGESERQLLAWIFSGYNIAYAAGLLTAGRFADVYGRKKSFLRGLAIFSIGSVLCGFAPSAFVLVLARVLQAIGGAILAPASLALVLPEYPVEKRAAALGIWGAVGGLAAAVG
ncbi:MAG: MFS transporter, partial [Actinomycetota bacterium]